jgi:uncharacterized integral membrane protein
MAAADNDRLTGTPVDGQEHDQQPGVGEPDSAPRDERQAIAPESRSGNSGASATTAPPVTGRSRRTSGVRVARTRISGTWVAVVVAAVVLLFLLIFILQNLATVTVHLLGTAGSLPLGVALLFAAIAGALLIALVGTARILQLRRQAKRGGVRRRR